MTIILTQLCNCQIVTLQECACNVEHFPCAISSICSLPTAAQPENNGFVRQFGVQQMCLLA